MLRKVGILFIFIGFILNSCNKNAEPTDLSDLIAIISMPTSTQESTDTTSASKAYDRIPQGIPIVVDVDKSPIANDPLDKGPFVNITKSIAHLGIRQDPDSLWGEWVFDTALGKWTKRTSSTDSVITFRWNDGNSLYTLRAEDFVLDQQRNILHAAFHLFNADSVELAQLVLDNMEYNINNQPISTRYSYNILNFVQVAVNATAPSGHNLREHHPFGTVRGEVNLNDDTIYTYVDNQLDLNQNVSVFFNHGAYTYRKNININAPDSINTYKFRDIGGTVLRESVSETDTIGILEGRIWYPEDGLHKNYLDVILSKTGERIHLWH